MQPVLLPMSAREATAPGRSKPDAVKPPATSNDRSMPANDAKIFVLRHQVAVL
jgi:hypothetical protein